MRKLNQTEIRALARQIIRRVNTQVDAHNEKLKTSGEYEEFLEDFPTTEEGKDIEIRIQRIKSLKEQRDALDKKIQDERNFFSENHGINQNSRYGGKSTSDDDLMKAVVRNVRNGKFREKERLSEYGTSHNINTSIQQIVDKLTIEGVSDVNIESKSDEIAFDLFKKL